MKILIIAVLSSMFVGNYAYAKACDSAAARYAVHSFYVVMDVEKIFSIPNDKQIRKLQPFLSKALFQKIEQARLADEKQWAQIDGQGPLGYEGSFFSSQVEGYSNFSVQNASINASENNVDVLLQASVMDMPYYQEKNYIIEWHDTVKTEIESDMCKISDIAFSNGDTLIKRAISISSPN